MPERAVAGRSLEMQGVWECLGGEIDRTWILIHHGEGGPDQGCPLDSLVCVTGFID